MTVTGVERDLEALTIVVTAEFKASVERVWQLWSDPRQLERWWGPPSYPATIVEHDLAVGGMVSYLMSGPDGKAVRGWWRVLAVDAPHSLKVKDGPTGGRSSAGPDQTATTLHMTFAREAAVTHLRLTSNFSSKGAMEQLIEMGMEQGLAGAVSQMDAVLNR